jgi:hypothetical protein
MNISFSIVDWIPIENGISVVLSLNFRDEIYEVIYWFDKKGDYRLVIQEDFLIKYKIKDIYKYKYLPDIIAHIDKIVLPPREEIWKEFDL